MSTHEQRNAAKLLARIKALVRPYVGQQFLLDHMDKDHPAFDSEVHDAAEMAENILKEVIRLFDFTGEVEDIALRVDIRGVLEGIDLYPEYYDEDAE